MDSTLQGLKYELDQMVVGILGNIPNDEPVNLSFNNWTYPGLTRREIAAFVEAALADIKEFGNDPLPTNLSTLLSDYIRRFQYIRTNTIPNLSGGAVHAVPAIYLTIDSFRTTLRQAIPRPEASASDALTKMRSIKGKVGALESRLQDLEPRSAKLDDMLARIETAYQAAEQLPSDLLQLEEDRARIRSLSNEAKTAAEAARASADNASEAKEKLNSALAGAENVLLKCESAYTAATSQGLAAAFSERSRSLDRSMWTWVAGMIAALIIGAYFGSQRLGELHDLVKTPNLALGTAVLNLMLAVLSVGGPIWFSWIATKQISQRFRLAEDYAFKAAVSRAYEGYRKEAARVDKQLEARLLQSALSRFDEQPLRFVDPKDHGSPWHELLTSDAVQTAIKSVPGFAERVLADAKVALNNVTNVVSNAKKPELSVVADDKTSVNPS